MPILIREEEKTYKNLLKLKRLILQRITRLKNIHVILIKKCVVSKCAKVVFKQKYSTLLDLNILSNPFVADVA